MPPRPKLPPWLARLLGQRALDAVRRTPPRLVSADERRVERQAVGYTQRPDVLPAKPKLSIPRSRPVATIERQVADALANPAAVAVESFGSAPLTIAQVGRALQGAPRELALWTGAGSALGALKAFGERKPGEGLLLAAGALPLVGQGVRAESKLARAIERAAANLPEIEAGADLLRLEHRSPHQIIDDVIQPGHSLRGPVRGAKRARESAFPELYRPRSYHTAQGGAVEAGFERLPVHIGEVPASRVYDWAADPHGVVDVAQRIAAEHGVHGPGVASVAEQILAARGYAGYRAGPTVAMFEPVPVLAGANRDVLDVARRYREASGIVGQALPRVPAAVDRAAGEVMARSYERLVSKPNDPAVREAYRQFMDETRAQYKQLQDAGYTFEFVDTDPYKNSAEMLRDLRENKHLRVFKSEEGGHPILTPEENDIFRAVHDAIGHGQFGYQFGPRGEENAFRAHAELYSPLARRAMATETRGQNSWVNFGPHAGKPVKERPFAEQKAALWPEGLMGDYPEVLQFEQIPTFERRGGRIQTAPGFSIPALIPAPPIVPKAPDIDLANLDIPTFVRRQREAELRARPNPADRANYGPITDQPVLDPYARIRNSLLQDEAGLLAGHAGQREMAVRTADVLPTPETLASGALAGSAKRGWYQNSAAALSESFGPEAPRFAALLAALSPQQGVEANLASALSMWEAWTSAGRPTDPRRIKILLNQVGRAQPGGGELPARIPNAVRALTTADPSQLVLSGPKVFSFHRNLIGDVNRVTLDTWMAQLGAINPTRLGGVARGDVKVASGPYLAYSGRIRETADYLTRATGRRWTPAEVQETLWSWGRGVGGEGSGAVHPSQLTLAPDLGASIENVPDFSTLLREPRAANALARLDLPVPAPRDPVPTHLGGLSVVPEHLRQLADNIARSRRGEYLLPGLLAGFGLSQVGEAR